MAESTKDTETKAATKPAAKTEDEQEPSFEDLEPKPAPASLNPVGADVSAIEVYDDDVDAGEVSIIAAVDYDADPVEDFDAEPVTSLQAASGSGGAVLAVNGTSYALNASQAATLGRLVNRMVAGLS